MSLIESVKYSKDNPEEYNINLDVPLKDHEERKKLDQERASMLAHSVKISKELFPTIDRSINQALEKLKIDNKDQNINFHIQPNSEANAYCRVVPFTNIVDIVINSRLVELLEEKEISYVIGHELAHYLYKHFLYPHSSFAYTKLEYTNLIHLQKSAEISADRLGLIACDDIKLTLQAMLKFATGLPSKYINFNFEAYLEQLKELKTIKNNRSQLYSTHPSFLNRIQSLIWFSKSDIYKDLNKLSDDNAYKIKDVDDMISQSIDEVIGQERTRENKDVFENYKLWGVLLLFLTDGRFQPEEREIFKEEFGEEKLSDVLSYLKLSNPKKLNEKIKDYSQEALALTKSDKEKLMNELEIIAGKIYDENNREINRKLSILAMEIDIKRSVGIKK